MEALHRIFAHAPYPLPVDSGERARILRQAQESMAAGRVFSHQEITNREIYGVYDVFCPAGLDSDKIDPKLCSRILHQTFSTVPGPSGTSRPLRPPVPVSQPATYVDEETVSFEGGTAHTLQANVEIFWRQKGIPKTSNNENFLKEILDDIGTSFSRGLKTVTLVLSIDRPRENSNMKPAVQAQFYKNNNRDTDFHSRIIETQLPEFRR